MKKIRLALLICLLFSGCTNKQAEIKKENVVNVDFMAGELRFEVKEDKIDSVIDILNEMEIDEQKEVNDHQESIWSIVIHENEDLIYWINQDGSLIKQADHHYTWIKPTDAALKEIYLEAIGNNIFLGEIQLSEDWIENIDENKHLYQFNLKSIQHALILGDHYYALNQEKTEVLVDALNHATYQVKEEQEWLNTRHPVVLYYDDTFYKVGYAYDEENQTFYFISFPYHDHDAWIVSTVEDGTSFAALWKELFGDNIFTWENEMDITDKPWLENVEENEEIVLNLCDHFDFDFCK